jgi:hypothetical protein
VSEKQQKKVVERDINKLKKNAWYDWECHKLRVKTFNLLNLHRKTNSILIKKQYLNSKKNYKILRELKQKKYFSDLTSKFKNVRDTKQFWDIVNKFRSKTPCC